MVIIGNVSRKNGPPRDHTEVTFLHQTKIVIIQSNLNKMVKNILLHEGSPLKESN